MELPPRVGRFTLREPAGGSSSSVVARAHDEARDVPAIVKLIAPVDDRFETRAMRELERWRAHPLPGHQKLIEIGRDGANLWYAAEPVAGDSLAAELIERRATGERWPDKAVFQLGRKVAAALDALHALQIVHGNLKPSNVLGRIDGDLVLTDSGLNRAVELAEVPAWMGGLEFYRHLSPDQLLGLKPLDARSDVFQLGLLLYECATLVHPFENVESPQALLDRSAAPITPPEKLVPGFDPKLSRAIMACLARERDRRHRSVKDFSRAWSGATAKYESLSDAPIAAIQGDGAGPRRTRQFSGPLPRATGRAHVSQTLDASIREIKPTPRWVQLAGVTGLALGVGAAGLWLYMRETSIRLDGGLDQRVGFGGTRVSYKTSAACETALRVSGEGTQARTFKNAAEGLTTKHSVMITDLTAGRKYLAQVELGEGPPSENVVLASPVVKPLTRIRIAAKGEDAITIAFSTPVKAKSTVHVKVDGHDSDAVSAVEPDVSHEATFEHATIARLSELSLEATDVEGERRSLSAGEILDQATAPLASAVTGGPLAAEPLPDAGAALERAELGPVLTDLANLGAWPFDFPDLSDERRRALFRAVNGLERALARSVAAVPEGLGVLKAFLESPHLRGQVAPLSEIAQACAGAGKLANAGPAAVLLKLGAFTRLKPGIFASAKARVAYDPKPQFTEVAGKSVGLVHLPAPPAGKYRSAQLAIAVSAIPRDGMLTVKAAGEPGELVLYNPAGRPAPPPGEQWLVRAMPVAAMTAGPAEISVALEPVGGASPAPLKILGALLIYR